MTQLLYHGKPVMPTPLASMTVVRRVPGGYLNHWLIREVRQEPCVYETPFLVFMHPALYEIYIREWV